MTTLQQQLCSHQEETLTQIHARQQAPSERIAAHANTASGNTYVVSCDFYGIT